MGGHALGVQMPRMSKATYEELSRQLKKALLNVFFGMVEAPIVFESKMSFGDIDLLVSTPLKPFDPLVHLCSTATCRHGNVRSFEYRQHQVDLIIIQEGYENMARFSYAYGDTGMIMCMMLKKTGLTLGMYSLKYTCAEWQISLSHDIETIFQFLGMDSGRWVRGFDNEKDLFGFLGTCRFFNATVSWNHETKSRACQRPMFRRWLDHVQNACPRQTSFDSEAILQAAITFFDKRTEYDAVQKKLSEAKLIKSLFNGSLVKAWTGNKVTGPALGEIMIAFKEHCPAHQMYDMCLADVQQTFDTWFRKRPAGSS